MSGMTDVQSILKSLNLQADPVEYCFCTFNQSSYGDHAELTPIASFIEEEGLTLVIPTTQADQLNIEYQEKFKRITLGVHSSLSAVGLTAAISTRLSEQGISANIIAAYYHDHVFVPSHQADAALQALNF